MAEAVPQAKGATVKRWTWTLTDADPTGAAIDIPDLGDKTIHVYGNFGGGTLRFEGSAVDVDAEYLTLVDAHANVMAYGSPAIAMVTQNPDFVRPKLTPVGAAALTVVVTARGHRV